MLEILLENLYSPLVVKRSLMVLRVIGMMSCPDFLGPQSWHRSPSTYLEQSKLLFLQRLLQILLEWEVLLHPLLTHYSGSEGHEQFVVLHSSLEHRTTWIYKMTENIHILPLLSFPLVTSLFLLESLLVEVCSFPSKVCAPPLAFYSLRNSLSGKFLSLPPQMLYFCHLRLTHASAVLSLHLSNSHFSPVPDCPFSPELIFWLG